MSEYPSEKQIEAIVLYAAVHGKRWKNRLLDDWFAGRCQGELQQVRNKFGPSWLQKFRLPD